MPLKFDVFTAGSIGEKTSVKGHSFGWVEQTFYFTDPDTTACPSVNLRVPLDYQPDWTVQQVHEAALRMAVDALRQALALAEQHGLQGFERLRAEREAAQEAEADRLQSFDPPVA